MAKLASKVQNALDEGRILVLGAQVLVGFELRAFFEEGFAALPPWARAAKVAALASMLCALALIILPSPFHRLAERGEDTPRLHAFARAVIGAALLPFALGLGLDVLVAAERIVGAAAAAWIAAGTCATALASWYGVALAARRPAAEGREEDVEPTPLEKKIRHVLTETRTVLPGAQALLGFQLAVTLTSAFRELPRGAQAAHLASILLTSLVIVLLVAPAAFHRIAERGEETERFHRVATGFVLAALAPLAASLAGGLGLVVFVVTGAARAGLLTGAAAFAALLVAWYGLPLAARARATRRPPRAVRREAHA